MKIVIDNNIPFIRTALSGIGDVISLPAKDIDRKVMLDTDILITRTRTICDASLLEGSRCSFIGTATIGTDHIDLDWCKANGIHVANAPGCNAPAVAQWVLSAISSWLKLGEKFADKTLGVIGAGNIGKILIRWAESLGMRVLVNDPPLADKEDNTYTYSSLDTLADECDIISVHTPLTHYGPHPTYHLLGEEFIGRLHKHPLLLNAARGAVADSNAIKKGLASGAISAAGIDCWEGEPSIDLRLLEMCAYATPHIAGYSYQGKIRASQMVLSALSSHLSPESSDMLKVDVPMPPDIPSDIIPEMIGYDILSDTQRLKTSPVDFERLRNGYILRNEPGA